MRGVDISPETWRKTQNLMKTIISGILAGIAICLQGVNYQAIAAVGKSKVAIELARQFNGEIINGDSVQVYRELNVGSAKITAEEMMGIPHHLLDYVNVGEEYSVRHFQIDARNKIEEISSRGKMPIVCGGTGLYVKALLYDYEFVEMENDHNEYSDQSTEQLYQRLLEVDPESTRNIHPNNRRRIVRALQLADSGNLKSRQEASDLFRKAALPAISIP